MNTTMKNNRSEQGNVLFLILIAVALFAALSYAVTKSTSGGGNADSETNILNAASMTQYPASLKTTILRMTINGIGQDSLDFTIPANFATDLPDANDQPFNIFHSDGGGAVYQTADSKVIASGGSSTWVFNANNNVLNVGTDGAPAGANVETIAFLVGVNDSVCTEINKQNGVTGIPTDDDEIDVVNQKDAATSTLTGTCTGTGACHANGIIGGGGASALDGKRFGCFQNSTGTIYFHVLAEK